MHVDSLKKTSLAPRGSAGSKPPMKRVELLGTSSSRDPKSPGAPFKDRIRAGMVVSWDATEELQSNASEPLNMVVVLSPAASFSSTHTTHIVSNFEESGYDGESERFLCALVAPGAIQNSYTVDLWRQAIITKAQMKAEVILEYDMATRYYHVAI